jgi:LAS superfamily LD-carboxypeptidase LdcB
MKEAREKAQAAVLRKNQMTTNGVQQAAAVKEQLAKKSGAAAPATPASPAAPAAAGAAPAAPSAAAATDKSLAFTGSSGSKSNFEQLNPAVKDRVTAAAEQYNEATGKKITVNSAKRDPADQARLYKETVDAKRPGIGPNGMAVAKPGRSKHEQGLAIDIQNYRDPAAVSAMNSKGLSQTVPNDPVHFEIPSAEEGGIVSGPASGYQTTMHGTEAVIPMQNNSGDFVKMFETMAAQSSRMADMLETLVRAQRDGNDISTKILRQQA